MSLAQKLVQLFFDSRNKSGACSTWEHLFLLEQFVLVLLSFVTDAICLAGDATELYGLLVHVGISLLSHWCIYLIGPREMGFNSQDSFVFYKKKTFYFFFWYHGRFYPYTAFVTCVASVESVLTYEIGSGNGSKCISRYGTGC